VNTFTFTRTFHFICFFILCTGATARKGRSVDFSMIPFDEHFRLYGFFGFWVGEFYSLVGISLGPCNYCIQQQN
jgi:hypothetical protein